MADRARPEKVAMAGREKKFSPINDRKWCIWSLYGRREDRRTFSLFLEYSPDRVPNQLINACADPGKPMADRARPDKVAGRENNSSPTKWS